MKVCILFAFSLFAISLNAQSSYCGTGIQDQAQLLQQRMGQHNFKNAGQAPIYIPLQVHNVGNDNTIGFFSNLIIFESLCTLNQDFLPSGIQFYLENDINYIRNTFWNSHEDYNDGEEMMLKSNYPNIINCYIVSNPAGNCGYFTYRADAVALSKNCVGKSSHTWAHELGHYFSLPHTFFGWEGIRYSNSKNTEEYQSQVFTSIENVDRNKCKSQADNFCDTEPDYISNRWSCAGDGFSGSILKDTQDSTFRVDGTLFMSYSNDDCMNRFSNDQMNAMHNFYNGPRANLKRANVIPLFLDKAPIILNYPLDSVIVPSSKILISWNPINNAKYYNLQISRTDNFTVIVKNLMVTTPFAEIDTLITNKNYWWRVRAFSDFDFCGPSSSVGLFRTDQIVASDNYSLQSNCFAIPNPANSNQSIIVKNAGKFSEESFIITSSLGNVHSVNGIEKIGEHLLFKLENLSAGLYFISTKKTTALKPIKLVIKK